MKRGPDQESTRVAHPEERGVRQPRPPANERTNGKASDQAVDPEKQKTHLNLPHQLTYKVVGLACRSNVVFPNTTEKPRQPRTAHMGS
jgi:hypothetical protein